jgi:hypothetical protein
LAAIFTEIEVSEFVLFGSFGYCLGSGSRDKIPFYADHIRGCCLQFRTHIELREGLAGAKSLGEGDGSCVFKAIVTYDVFATGSYSTSIW